MTTKFDHIVLSRAFRPVALATIKAHSGWPSYMTSKGYDGRSEDLTKPEIHQACEDLGIDLQGLYDGFHGAAPRPVSPIVDNAAEDERIEAMIAEQHAPEAEPASALEGRDVDDVIAEALAPVSVHMTPHLFGLMPGILKPIVEAAVRGPRIVTQVETVTVDGSGANIAAVKPMFRAPVVRVTKTLPLYQAFGLRKSDAKPDDRYALENTTVSVCDYSDPLNPVDADYMWNAEMLVDLAIQDTAGLNGWVYGPAGVGKTVGLEQYAARLGRPFVRIALNRTTEDSELIGQDLPASMGGWRDGKLTRAFRIPFCVILIDEPSLLRSGTLACIQTALDQRAIHLVTGEIVRAAPGIFICVADNTAGNGDDTGRYVDTSPLNAAFLDRFGLKTAVSWLTVGQETSMLASRARIHPVAAKIMVEYANSTRTQADAGQITMGVTPRRLLAWARAAKAGKASAKAWHSTIVTGAAPEDREKLIALEAVDLRAKHDRIDQIVRGLIDPLAPVADPKAHVQGGVGPTAIQFPDDDPTV